MLIREFSGIHFSEFHPEVDKNDYDSLHLSIIIFIIFMWTMDYYYHGKLVNM